MPTKEGCTNLPEPESRFRRSVSVSMPPSFTKSAVYSVCVCAAGGEPSSPETSTIGADKAVLRHARGVYDAYCITEKLLKTDTPCPVKDAKKADRYATPMLG